MVLENLICNFSRRTNEERENTVKNDKKYGMKQREMKKEERDRRETRKEKGTDRKEKRVKKRENGLVVNTTGSE